MGCALRYENWRIAEIVYRQAGQGDLRVTVSRVCAVLVCDRLRALDCVCWSRVVENMQICMFI